MKVGIIGHERLANRLVKYGAEVGVSVATLRGEADTIDADTILTFAENLDAISVQRFGVDADILRWLTKKGVQVYPSPETLEIIQDRFLPVNDIRQDGHYVSVIISRNTSGICECFAPIYFLSANQQIFLDFRLQRGGSTPDLAYLACSTAVNVADDINLTGLVRICVRVTSNRDMEPHSIDPGLPMEDCSGPAPDNPYSVLEARLRKTLGLPGTNTQMPPFQVLEPGAHRKQTISDALQTILGTHNSRAGRGITPLANPGNGIPEHVVSGTQAMAVLSKSTMIRYLLS